MCLNKKLLAFSLVIGLAITLASSIVMNRYVIGEFPDVRFVSLPIIGVGYWGHPLPWVRQVVYPGAEKEFVLSHLIIDFIFWTGIAVLSKMFFFEGTRGKKIGLKIRKKIKTKVRRKKKRKTKLKKKPKRKSRRK